MNMKLIIALCLSLLFFSCTPEVGLFYSITLEEEPVESSLSATSTPGSLVTDGSGVMLLAAAGLYVKEMPENSWPETVIELTSIDAELPVGSLALSAAYTDAFYVCFTSSEDGSSAGLYSTPDPASSSPVWTKTAGLTNPVIVFSENGVLFVITEETDGIYSLSSNNGSGFNNELSGLPAARSCDVAFDGASYWFVWGRTMYSGTLGALNQVDVSVVLPSVTIDFFGGIHFDSASGLLYLSVNDLANGSIYTKETVSWVLLQGNMDRLHDFFSINRGGSDLVLVGSYDGYYEQQEGTGDFLSPSLSCGSVTYKSLDISSAVIRSFFLNGDDLYALTVNAGLWKNSDTTWFRE